MPLLPLNFTPGIDRRSTRATSEGGWWDCDKIRFHDGFPQTIGGWQRRSDNQFLGTCRSLYAWVTLQNEVLFGMGTNLKYYIEQGGAFYDITPIRETTAAGDVTFSASAGSSTITVSDASHGAILNDYVTFVDAVSLGGDITADILNAEHQITEIVDGDSYTIEVSTPATTLDSGNGGASTYAEYQINTGLDSSVLGTGWGAGPWGDGGWGESAGVSAGEATLRIWSQDNFGEDLVINPTEGGIYYWDASVGTSTRAVALSALSGASDAPTVASRILVSDQDRHVIAFGADDEFNPGVQDPLLIRWSDQENAADWTTRTTNTAGSIRLSSGSKILSAVQTKREIVVFTDLGMHSMQFIGPPYTFGIQQIARDVQLQGPQAVVAVSEQLYWMSNGKFMVYDGVVTQLPCPIESYVFEDLNYDEVSKVVSGHNIRFSEVWWFYPSAASSENDRYVIYNYKDGAWSYGTLSRTAWMSSGYLSNPLAAAPDNYLYDHEIGFNDGSTNPPSAIAAYVESAATDIDVGDRFFFATRALPDVRFIGTANEPSVTMTFKGRRFPGTAFNNTDDGVVTASSGDVGLWTERLDIRVRGRTLAVRVESEETNNGWQLGVSRIDLRTDGAK